MGWAGWQVMPISTGPSPRGVWVDHSILTSLVGFLPEAVVLSWRLIRWDQLRGNASPELATVMLAMAAESVRGYGWTNHSIYYTPGLACSVWSIGG